jgi:hypothetical protein
MKTYNDLLHELYAYYCELYEKDKTVGLLLPIKNSNSESIYTKPPIKLFEGMLEDDSFCEKIGVDYYKRNLTYKERYHIWFKNNYETGMEYYDESEVDFDNSYYDFTPSKLIVIKFNNKNYVCYSENSRII